MSSNTETEHELKAEVQRWLMIFALIIVAYNLEDWIVTRLLLLAAAVTALVAAWRTWRGRDE